MNVTNTQQNSPSLQEVMNRMAQRVDGLQARDRARAAGRGVLSEAEAYAPFDPLLAQLLKEYRDAQARHEDLLQRHGAGDAMAAVAEDLVLGCDSAVETRLMELRTQNTLRRMAEARMRDSVDLMNASARYKAQMHSHVQRRAEMARIKRKEAFDGMFWLWFVLTMLQITLDQAQRRLSAAQAFMDCARDERHAAVA